MAVSKESSLIEKLNVNNYSTWRFKIEMLLIKENLFEQITNEPPDPVTAAWRKNDNRARALINLYIDDSQIVHIKHVTSAKGTLEALKQIHERSNLTSKLFMLRKLYNTKLNEGGNMNAHITKMLEIIDKLRAIGEEISDSHISALLLCSVPKSYDTLITALEARNEDELNPQFIRSKLIDEYQRRIESSIPDAGENRAFQINKQKHTQNNYRSEYSQNRSYNGTRKINKFCVFCKKSNHNKDQCWLLKRRSNNNYNTNRDNKSSYCQETNERVSDENKSVHGNPRNTNTGEITGKLNNFAFTTGIGDKNTWIFDSGSSTHISNNRDLFTKIYDVNKSNVIVANGQVLTSYGSGEIELISKTSQNITNNITLKNVLYVPDIQTNLLSVKKATENGSEVNFSENECSLIHKGKIYLTGHIKDNLYEVDFQKTMPKIHANLVNECKYDNCIEIWHKRLGHRNYDSINKLVNENLAIGLKMNKCNHRLDCEICIKSKLTSKPYPKKAQHRADTPLELIHTDLCGPMKTPTLGGKFYLLTFIDDYSRYTTTYFLTHKSEVIEKLKEYVALMKNKFGRLPKAIRSDNGREYVNNEMENFLKLMGIRHQLSVPHSAPQNGVAERKNRSLIEMTRCLLNQANLSHSFWGEGVNTANYLQNRLPTKSNNKTPFELWEKYRPNLSHLKIFGCKVYAYVDKVKRTKLDDRGIEGTFVGYDTNSKGYRIFTDNKVIISRTVKFLENIIPNRKPEAALKESKRHDSDQVPTQNKEIDFNSSPELIEQNDSDANINQPRRSERQNIGVPPDRLAYLTKNDIINEPKSWNEIQNMKNPREKQNWIKAAEEEINSLQKNKTWMLVDPPQGKNIIGSKWTFKIKYNSEGKIERQKARLVAKGFSQRFGENYDETFAPVVSHTTIRALLATAIHKKLNINHIDIKTAFLHGDLNETVYMTQPEGFVTPGQENKVCQLQKAIYGLKQAARAWQAKIEKTLKDIGYTQSAADPCLYKRKKDEKITYLVVYVDDILIAGENSEIQRAIEELNEKFEIKDLGPVKHYLGIGIRRTEEGYFAINQNFKISEIVNKFNLNDAKPCYTPMEPGYVRDDDDDHLLPNNTKYRQAIGALLYIATISRPDILAPISILSRRNEKPRNKDWEQVKRVIKYLKTTNHLELVINPNPDAILTCYADADWAGDKSDRKSTTGNLFLLGKSPIHWISKKQSNIALSSAEAEFVSAAHATQELLWLIKLLTDLDLPQSLPVKVYEDNIPCIKMIETPKYTNKTKHMDIKYHCVKALKEQGIIDIHYCPTEDMTADILTKPAPRPSLEKHRRKLQLIPHCKVLELRGSVGI